MCELLAARQRAPAHVLHLRDRILQRHFLVQLDQLGIQVEVLDVAVIQRPFAISVRADQLRHLSVLDLLDHKVLHTFLTEEVLAAGEEHEFLAQDLTLTNGTLMQFRVKGPPIRLLG